MDAETDGALISAFLSEGYAALNMCVCPSCSWRHVAQEAIAVHYPQRRQFFLYVPAAHRHRAQTIRANFLASVEAAPGAHVPRYVFEPILVGSRTELKQLIGDDRVFTRGVEEDYSSLGSESGERDLAGSVVRRSQTLNLLAELVGEEPDAAQLQNADAELSNLGNRSMESVRMAPEQSVDVLAEDAMTTQREFDPEAGGATRDNTAAMGLLAAGIDERAQTQSIVMPDGVADSVEANQSQLDLSDDAEDDLDMESVEFDTADLSGNEDRSHGSDTPDIVRAVSNNSENCGDTASSVDQIESTPAKAEVPHDEQLRKSVQSVGVTEVRQPVPSGSVELAADYTQELQAHSRPPSEADAVSLGADGSEEGALESGGLEHRVELTDAGVVLRSSLSTELVERLGNRPVQVVPQLHEFEEGRVCTLTVFVDSDESVAPLYWVLDESANRDQVLGQLEAQFCLHLDLQSVDSNTCLVAEYRFPLESNVTAIKRRLESTTERQEADALSQLESNSSFSTGLVHSFERDSFCAISSAAEAFFALGIVEFWSDPARSIELWGRMGFPLDWWQAIQRRVMVSAADFGLVMSPAHTTLTLAVLDVDDESTYLQSVIDNFVEVNLRIKANGLDVVQMAQVWDQLLARAQELGLPLDPEVEELASQALDKGEIALDDEVSPIDDSIDAIEISLADALEVASIGGVNIKDLVSFDRPTLSMIEPNFGEVSDRELIEQLSDSDKRVESALTLATRDAGAHAEVIYSVMQKMSSQEVAQVLPSLVKAAAQFQGLFRGGLFADEHQLRLGAALYLIETRDDRVINPLLAMILDPEESEWEALALSAVEFGSAIAKSALSRVSIDASSTTRVAYLLTALEKAQPGLLSALGGLVEDAPTTGCIQAALSQVETFENLFTGLEFTDRIALTLASPSA